MLLLSCLFLGSQAQSYNRWYFGYNQGFLFTNSGIVLDTNSAISSFEGCATVVDSKGKLLFYASPEKVWDSTHTIMPNGDSLAGHVSAREGIYTCRHPEGSNKYFVFTLEAAEVWAPNSAELNYSVVDMSLNGGLGDVIATEKNVLINDTVFNESMALTLRTGTEELEYWLTTRVNGPKILVYRVHAGGVDLWSEYSFPGISGLNTFMLFREQGDLMAMSQARVYDTIQKAGIYFLDFDSDNGLFTDHVFIHVSPQNYFGYLPFSGAFSENGKYYYTFSYLSPPINNYSLISYDLGSLDSAQLQSNCDTLVSAMERKPFTLRLAPNDTVYIVHEPDTSQLYLSAISDPDQLQGFAQYHHNEQPILQHPNNLYGLGLPTTISLIDDQITATDFCFGDSTVFSYIGICDSLRWSFGDGGQATNKYLKHNYADTGSYLVTLFLFRDGYTDTLELEIFIIPEVDDVLPERVFLCADSTVEIDLDLPFVDSVLWSDGDTSLTRQFSESDSLTITVFARCNTLIDTLVVVIDSFPSVELIDTMALCENESVFLNLDIPTHWDVSWSNGSLEDSIQINAWNYHEKTDSIIRVTVANACGQLEDSTTTSLYPIPNSILSNDTFICGSNPLVISLPYDNRIKYVWLPDSTVNSVSISDDTTLLWSGFNLCGQVYDSLGVSFSDTFSQNLGSDTVLCPDDTIILSVDSSSAANMWIPSNQMSRSLMIFRDAEGDVYIDGSHYQTESFIEILLHSGYEYCIDTSSITIFLPVNCEEVKCKFSIPNVFTPNGDGKNDRLEVVSMCGLKPFTLNVYNRWGQLLYSAQSYVRQETQSGIQESTSFLSWDGYSNGTLCTEGTYFVVVESNGESIQRNSVTIIH